MAIAWRLWILVPTSGMSVFQQGSHCVKRNLGMAAGLLVSVLATTAQANDALGLAVAGKVSTLGYGVELGYRFNNYLGLRAGLNKGSFGYSNNYSGTDYNYTMDFDNIPVSLDWFVLGGTFRVTGGVVSNNNKLTGISNGTANIGGTVTTATVTTETTFAKTSTYLGLGWGGLPSTTKGFGLSFDIGVMGQGSPTTTITAPGVPPADIAAEEATINSDLKNYKYWPVVTVGIGYTF
jgi:hypothetical protein